MEYGQHPGPGRAGLLPVVMHKRRINLGRERLANPPPQSRPNATTYNHSNATAIGGTDLPDGWTPTYLSLKQEMLPTPNKAW